MDILPVTVTLPDKAALQGTATHRDKAVLKVTVTLPGKAVLKVTVTLPGKAVLKVTVTLPCKVDILPVTVTLPCKAVLKVTVAPPGTAALLGKAVHPLMAYRKGRTSPPPINRQGQGSSLNSRALTRDSRPPKRSPLRLASVAQ